MNQNQDLPRFDLREPAFRKYERVISKALESTEIIVDPRSVAAEGRPMNAYTFCRRFKDACSAFRRFGYASQLISRSQDLGVLRVSETAQGQVRIRNMSKFSLAPSALASGGAQAEVALPRVKDWDKLVELAKAMDAHAVAVSSGKADGCMEQTFSYDTDEERDRVLKLDGTVVANVIFDVDEMKRTVRLKV